MESPTQEELQQTPPGDDVWDKLAKSLRGEKQKEEQDDASHPVRSFWDRLVHGNEDQSKLERVGEVGRSAARGVVGAAKEGQETVAAVAKATNSPLIELTAKAGAKLSEKVQNLFGRRSDDPLASFAESTAQFVTGFEATPMLGAAKGAKLVTKIASSAARGAIADGAAFDPNEAGLAELLARVPLEPIRKYGEMLTVKGDDPELVKRMKRGAAGVIPGVALDGLIAGAQKSWAHLRPNEPAAVKIGAEAAKVLQDIKDGTHVPEGAHVKVVPNEDGSFGLKPVTVAEEIPDTPKFADRAEAEMQAETINNAMNERMHAAEQKGGLTQPQAEELRMTFRKFLTAADAESVEALKEGTHFNFSYHSEPKSVLAQIESVSKVFKEELDAAQKVGGITVEKHGELVSQMLDGIDLEEQAPALTRMLTKGSTLPRSVVESAANVVLRDIATKTSNLFDVVTARPHDVIAWEEARLAASNLVDLQKALAAADSDAGRALKFRQDRDAIAEAVSEARTKPKAPKVDEAVEGAAAEAPKAGAKKVSPEIAGMSKAEVLGVLKMSKMAGGSPSKLLKVPAGARIIKETSMVRRGLEFFVNSALSGPATSATALTMNTLVSTFEAGSKMFSGALTANKGLMREGWDILAANELFLADNIRAASMAFKAGHSIINPGEVHQAIPGAVGDAIRTPAKALLFVDEFTRVSNYRSFVRAKSLRYWRGKGLDGESLAKAVATDVRDSFDAKTGVAVIPDALKYAEVPTMSADLGRETLGGGLASFLNNHVEAKFIAPFVKTSVNVFRYTFDRTPLLNRAAKRNREILKAGGEAAATLHTQSLMATSLFFYGYMKAKAGEITGAGPKDPGLRRLWLANNNKPYSMKIDGEWHSYRRLSPLVTPMSLMADVHDMVQELGAQGRETDAEDVVAASLAGIAASFGNQTYMTGMTQFFEAWSGGKGETMKKWLQGFGTTFTDPQLLRQLNDDPYLRETESFKDAMMAGIPGLSDKLPARYDLFGEPILAQHSLMPAPNKGSAAGNVAGDLLTLGRSISPLNRNSVNGVPVDLADGAKFGRKDGLTPYEYAQKLIREPGDGEPSLKKALTDLVKSDDWKEASPGSELYPGGDRFIMAYRIIDSYRRRAIAQTIERFPTIEREIEMQKAIKGASTSEGQKGALDVLREYGKK